MLTAGTALADRIVAHGGRTVFALAGAGHTHLLLPLEDRGVQIIGGRHETGTVCAADGYARISGGLGFALIIAEQGLPNAISALATAYQFGSPVVVLVTRFPDAWTEPAAEFVVDHQQLLTPITKWAQTVPSADRLVEYFEAACRIAEAGRPGPVVLTFPQNFLTTPVDPAAVAATADLLTSRARSGPAPAPNAIGAAARLLAAAERPLIITDSGATWDAAGPAVRELATRYGIPALGIGLGRGLVPEDDRLGFPWTYAQIAAREADVVLALGVRFNMWLGFGRPPRFSADAKLIQVDTDARELGRNRAPDLSVVASTRLFCEGLIAELRGIEAPVHSPAWMAAALEPRRARVLELERAAQGAIHPLELSRALAEQLPAEAIIVGDGADILNWTYGSLRVRRAPGYLDHQPLGSMGVGLPLAIGAAAAERDRAAVLGQKPAPTVLVTGDGSLGFYLAELDTLRRAALRLTILVGNDGLWSTEYHGQMVSLGRAVNTTLGRSDYAASARSLGVSAERVVERGELGPAIAVALESGAPALLDVWIDPEAGRDRKKDPRVGFVMFSDLAPASTTPRAGGDH